MGSGVFGLSTAYALARRPSYSTTKITVISWDCNRNAIEASDSSSKDRAIPASYDTTRIIRADYAEPNYAKLAQEAQSQWRTNDWGGLGRYNETGLLITASSGSTGEAYVRKALANVNVNAQSDDHTAKELNDQQSVADAMRVGSEIARGTGNVGYVNQQSGWADAGRCMQDLEAKTRALNRVRFVRATVSGLMVDHKSSKILGVKLAGGRNMEADCTIVATGAWTPTLIDLRGRASSTAQVMAYFDIPDRAAHALADIPVHLNITTGCFLFPPNRKPAGGYEIKVARHAYGYANPCLVKPPAGCAEDIEVSVPAASSTSIPRTDQVMLSEFLEKALPVLGKVEQPSRTRLCHYLDTIQGEYIVSYHPEFEGLFLATGGSGHAFKFLPVLGEKVVDVLSGADCHSAWAEKWRYPERQLNDMVFCDDGSRSGLKDLVLPRPIEDHWKARL